MDYKRIALENIDQKLKALDKELHTVLYASPIELSKKQSEFITQKYASMIESRESENTNILSYQSLDKKRINIPVLSQFIEKLYSFCLFMLLMRAEVKSFKTLHLFRFNSVSFIFQIIPLLVLGKFYRKNVIVEFFDFHNFYYPEETGTLARFFLKVADRVVVPTGRQCRSLKQKRIKATTFATEYSKKTIQPRVIEEVQPKILVSASFEDVLNINCILDAYSLVKQKYPRTELVLAGEGSQKENYHNIISSNSYAGVSIEGNDSNTKFTDVDIFVHCYHIEYYAHEILDAMAHGLPVIASPVGMVSGLIHKENILMYQFNDYSTLADNLLLLIEDRELTKKISVNGSAYIKELSKMKTAQNYMSFYKNLL